jgi:2-desacetyl-2-hydroxyethyl bacteriochlorophyllide A dehydrogenase
MMQIVLDQPGNFLVSNGPRPAAAPGEALVRVHRVGICGTDLHAFAGRQPFFTYPRILGHELGVEILDPGDDAGQLRAGDRCAVEPYLNCGQCIACRRGTPNCCVALKVLGVHIDGGMRPLLAVPARKLHRSESLGYDQLALVETLAIGAHAVERAAIRPDDVVLVIGAGPIGLGVSQFAALAGGTVVVMDVSKPRLTFCRDQIGVAHVVEAGPEAATQLRAIAGGDLPTVVIDATGNPTSMTATFDLVAHGGRVVFVGLFQGSLTFDDPNFHRREITLLASRNALPGTFRDVITLIESDRLDTRPWITHRLELAATPGQFKAIAGTPGLIKAVISVPSPD